MTPPNQDEAERIWKEYKATNEMPEKDSYIASGFGPNEMKYMIELGFRAGQKSPKVMRLVEAMQRLTKVCVPAGGCAGSELAGLMLEENCAIAKEALAAFGEVGKDGE